mmetsp:Transcript_16971/g.21651  ORF Transcript_16971/g.21651 Transcript_16971/m.21651 type:complete len:658 (-) Transcript_16971:67-2040(-)
MAVDLSQLQNKIKRDKSAYFEEFQLQHRHYLSELQLFQQNPETRSKTFTDLVGFIAQVAPCYPHQLKKFPQQLCDLLEQQATVLHPETRLCIAKALILLRNRDLLSATILLPLFFKMFRVHDKPLRNLLRKHIVSDIKKVNRKRKNQKLNTMLQNFMSVMLRDASETAARHSIEVMIDLYRKNIWNDERTVNVVTEACLSKNTKILVPGLQFFLANSTPKEDDEEEETNAETNAKLQKLLHGHSRMTKKRKSRLDRYRELAQKEKKRDNYLTPNFPAIQLIHDPLGFAEKLFGALKSSTDRFEVKLMMMNLISRLIATHKLQLINFYPWIQRYLQPHQEEVTHILCILAQSVHDLIDQESILPTVRALANNFITDRCSANAIAVGLNTIREICMRCPYAMDDTLLQDLVEYKKNKEKSVSMAARSLISLYRELDPSMLAKKDRGKDAKDVEVKVFGQFKPTVQVDGTELLGGDAEESDSEDETAPGEIPENTKSLIGMIMDASSDDEEELEPKTRIEMTRVLTDDDFREIEARRMMNAAEGNTERKRSREAFNETYEITDEVGESTLTAFIKKPKANKADRLASVMEGREGRGKFGSRKGEERGSTTNEEKKKNQPFILAKQSIQVKRKTFRSITEKNNARRKHVNQAVAMGKRKRM